MRCILFREKTEGRAVEKLSGLTCRSLMLSLIDFDQILCLLLAILHCLANFLHWMSVMLLGQ